MVGEVQNRFSIRKGLTLTRENLSTAKWESSNYYIYLAMASQLHSYYGVPCTAKLSKSC